jgi:hypothetical protein
MARSQLLYSYWGLDRLVPHSWNSSAKDNVLTVTTKIKDHDSAFDTGFNNEIAPCLPGVTAQDVREALLNDGIEVFEKTKMFRLKPTYQATLLALQHALFRCRERQIAADKEVKTKAGMRASLVPPFAALVYLYFNSMNPKQNALLMLNALSGAPSSYGSGDLCRAFVTSELPPGVIKVLANCPNGRLNCHGYMNALRFEFVRQVYELLFKNANVGSVRGCANP